MDRGLLDRPISALGRTCAAHAHRELVPMEDHHVWPRGEGGPDVPANIVRLCSNGHGQVHWLLSLLIKHNGDLPWSTRRQYGVKVRQLAALGWRRIQEQRL